MPLCAKSLSLPRLCVLYVALRRVFVPSNRIVCMGFLLRASAVIGSLKPAKLHTTCHATVPQCHTQPCPPPHAAFADAHAQCHVLYHLQPFPLIACSVVYHLPLLLALVVVRCTPSPARVLSRPSSSGLHHFHANVLLHIHIAAASTAVASLPLDRLLVMHLHSLAP